MFDEGFSAGGPEEPEEWPSGPADLTNVDEVVDKLAREAWSKGAGVGTTTIVDRSTRPVRTIVNVWSPDVLKEIKQEMVDWVLRIENGENPPVPSGQQPCAIVKVDHVNRSAQCAILASEFEATARLFVGAALGPGVTYKVLKRPRLVS
jgi:hypothetical protein